MKRIISFLLVALLILSAVPMQLAYADSTPVLSPGITSISNSNALLGVKGTYEHTSAEKLLKRVNQIRKEAYDEGLVSSYVPIKWSDCLEYIAQIRAVEASVYEDHERPKGGYMYSMSVNGVQSYAENLAWGGDALDAVEMWYSEKSDYVNKTGGQTGHYESLIDPEYTYIGIGSFSADSGYWNCVSAEFTSGSGYTENRTETYGACIQLIEIPKSDIKLSLSGSESVAAGSSSSYKLKAKYNGFNMYVPGAIWSSSDEAVAAVSDGAVTGVAGGTADITAELEFYGIASGLTASKTVTVSEKAGDAGDNTTGHTDGGNTYSVISGDSKTVAFVKAKNTKTVTVPATVVIDGDTYKVTRVDAKAFTGSSIRTVVIGKNVKTIKKSAFAGTKITKLIVKTKKLTKASVKNSLKGSKVKIVQVKVGTKKQNKTYVKKYKKIFTKANAGKKVTVK